MIGAARAVSLAFVLPLAALACDADTLKPPAIGPPEGIEAADFRDGTRLTFPLWRTADGFSVRQGTIHDRLLDVTCAFTHATDGKRRCLPTSLSSSSGAFADARCTQPLALEGTGEPYVRFDMRGPGSFCEGTDWLTEIREGGAPVGMDTVYRSTTDGCEAFVPHARQNFRYTGAVVPPERFVAAEEVVVPPPGRARLGTVLLVAEDGAWFKQPALHDTRDGLRCQPRLASDGRIRCLPAGRFAVSFGGDRGAADCSGPQIVDPVACPAGAVNAAEVWSTTCPQHLELHAPGASVPDGPRFGVDGSGVCVGGTVLGGGVQVGPELAPARFALLEERQLGAGRLRRSVYVDVDIAGAGAGGATLPVSDTSAYDTLLGAPCTFFPDESGATRCQPRPSLLTTAFRDARCSDAVAVDTYSFLVDPCFHEVDPVPRYASMNGALFGPATRAAEPFRLLYILVGPNAFCQEAAHLLGSEVTHYNLGPGVPFDLVTALP
jgi:hypothetical protein